MKIDKIMKFLYKKRALLLGVFIGIIVALLFSVNAFASSSLLVETAPSGQQFYMAYDAYSEGWDKTGKQINRYVSTDIDIVTDMVAYATHYKTFENGVIQYQVTIMCSQTVDSSEIHWSNWDTGDRQIVNYTGKSWNVYADSGYRLRCYEFSSKAEAEAYLNGEIDASAALNRDYVDSFVLDNLWKKYDETIPIPEAFISSLSESSITTNIEYDAVDLQQWMIENDIDEVKCEVTTIHYYQYLTKEAITNMKNGNNELSITQGLSYGDINTNNLLEASYTPEQWWSKRNDSSSAEFSYTGLLYESNDNHNHDLVVSNSSFTVTDSVNNYYALMYNEKALFTPEQHMQYIGSQVKIRTYYIVDGSKTYGNDVYVRRFLFSKYKDEYGNAKTVIKEAYNESGEESDGSYMQMIQNDTINDNGSSKDSSMELNSDSVMQNVENGFGLLGDDGYINLTNRFLYSVPADIWAMISAAMALSIILILFKVLRGM